MCAVFLSSSFLYLLSDELYRFFSKEASQKLGTNLAFATGASSVPPISCPPQPSIGFLHHKHFKVQGCTQIIPQLFRTHVLVWFGYHFKIFWGKKARLWHQC